MKQLDREKSESSSTFTPEFSLDYPIARMAQEFQIHDSGGSDCSLGFGKSSIRKSKQRRAPQRGLGVAKLEKIRLEEQQNKNGSPIFSPPSSLSPPKSCSKLSVSASNLHHIKQSSPIFDPSNFAFKSPLPAHSVDDKDIINSTPLIQLNNGGFETEWSNMPVLGQGQPEVHKPWNPLVDSVSDFDLGFQTNFGLASGSNPSWPSSGLVLKEQQHQPSFSAGVDVPSLSLLNFLTELPSNQSYCSNYSAAWPEMFGMKRPCAFSMDNIRPPMAAPLRSDDSAFCSNISLYSYPFLGEGPCCSSSSSEPNSNKKMKINAFRGDLLTLATPTTPWISQSSKLKQLSAHDVDSNHDFEVLVPLPLRGGMEIPTCSYTEPSWSNPLPQRYHVFPPEMAQSDQVSPKILDRVNVEDESVDLNLRL